MLPSRNSAILPERLYFWSGASDGLAYNVLNQDANGNWQAGAVLPCQKWFAELVVELSDSGNWQVVGRDASGLAYLAAELKNGIWQSGGLIQTQHKYILRRPLISMNLG